MNVVGLGTRILECVKVSELLGEHAEKFILQVYTDREAAYCRDRTHTTEYYAAIWAAKEAVFHSLGMRWKRGVDWRDVEIVCENPADPRVEVNGATRSRMDDLGVGKIMISFSHTRHYATATAISLKV